MALLNCWGSPLPDHQSHEWVLGGQNQGQRCLKHCAVVRTGAAGLCTMIQVKLHACAKKSSEQGGLSLGLHNH